MARRTSPVYDSIRYGYAVGRVRVLETRLLKRSHYERLLDARDFAEQRRVLSETVYGAYLERTETAEDVEIAVDRALADLYADFLETANLPDEMVEYFRAMHDFENLRGRLKAEALGVDPDEMLNNLGSVPPERIASGALPKHLAAAERRIRARAERDGALWLQRVDVEVDRELFGELRDIAARADNPHLRTMVRVSADLATLRAFVRLKAAGGIPADFAAHIVPGGTIDAADISAVARLPVEDALARLTARPTLHGADPAAFAELDHFDVVADRLIVERLRDARRVAIGPEPVVAYVVQRKFEASMLRMLLIGRIAGVSRDTLRARLRDVA